MAEQCLTRMNTRWLLASMLLSVLLPSVYAVSCTQSCICVFDQVLTDNTASCQFGNSNLEVAWDSDYGRTLLKITCSNAYKGLQYDCEEFPRFNISNANTLLNVRGCAPSVMRCVSKLFLTPVSVIQVDSYDMVDAYVKDDLRGMDKVERLRMYLTDDTVDMPATAINAMPALTYTIITGGHLQLSSNVFQHSNLQYMCLHLNNIEGLPPSTFSGLPNLNFLEIRSSYFKHLGAESFKGLSAVVDLVVENDTLTTIDPDAFSSMKQLTTLYIKNNTLKFVPNGLFTGLDNLYKIRITMNQVEINFDTHAFADLPHSVRILDVPTSWVRTLPEYLLNGSSNIHQLYFHRNQIETLPPKLLSTNTELRYVDFNHNKIKGLPDKIFASLKRLQHIDFSYNLLSSLKGDLFTYSPVLKDISLNNNQISQMDLNIFKGTALRTLNLTYNSLQRIIGEISPNWSTKKLNLSHNKLSVFETWFIRLSGLENLDLSSNRIETFNESFIYHSKTKLKIDLRNNSITHIIRDMNDAQISFSPGDITLYLSNNPFDCDCIVITLLKEWHKYGFLADFDDIVCSNNEKLSNLDIYIQCNKTQAFIALIGSSVVGTLIIVLIIMYLFTHRKYIWEFILNIFKNDNSDRDKTGTDNLTFQLKEDKMKSYDLFISFAHPDSEFVTDKLLPTLELEFNLKVCVHYRDWIVGDLIPDQIKESVESSSMTMIVLTEHFLLSDWSGLEFRTAHNLSIEDGKQRVIIILLDESITRHDKLSSDIKSYLNVNTYLVWDDMTFWDKMQKILPKKNKSKKKYLK